MGKRREVRQVPIELGTERGEARLMTAKYRGKCADCRKPIKFGSPIVWGKAIGAMHPWCALVEVPANFGVAGLAQALAAASRIDEVPAPLVAELGHGVVVELGRPVHVPALIAVPDVPAEADDSGWWDSVMAGEVPAMAGGSGEDDGQSFVTVIADGLVELVDSLDAYECCDCGQLHPIDYPHSVRENLGLAGCLSAVRS